MIGKIILKKKDNLFGNRFEIHFDNIEDKEITIDKIFEESRSFEWKDWVSLFLQYNGEQDVMIEDRMGKWDELEDFVIDNLGKEFKISYE